MLSTRAAGIARDRGQSPATAPLPCVALGADCLSRPPNTRESEAQSRPRASVQVLPGAHPRLSPPAEICPLPFENTGLVLLLLDGVCVAPRPVSGRLRGLLGLTDRRLTTSSMDMRGIEVTLRLFGRVRSARSRRVRAGVMHCSHRSSRLSDPSVPMRTSVVGLFFPHSSHNVTTTLCFTALRLHSNNIRVVYWEHRIPSHQLVATFLVQVDAQVYLCCRHGSVVQHGLYRPHRPIVTPLDQLVEQRPGAGAAQGVHAFADGPVQVVTDGVTERDQCAMHTSLRSGDRLLRVETC